MTDLASETSLQESLDQVQFQIDSIQNLAVVEHQNYLRVGVRIEIPIFSKSVLALVGPSGAGKTHISKILDQQGQTRVCNGTTRPLGRDANDGAGAYISFPHTVHLEGIDFNLGDPEYIVALKAVMNLAEANDYGGHIYGTPWFSFMAALDIAKCFAVWGADPNGIEQVRPKFDQKGISLLPVCVVPESADKIWESVRNRNNPISRIRTAARELEFAQKNPYLLFLNKHGQDGNIDFLSYIMHRYIHNASQNGQVSLIVDPNTLFNCGFYNSNGKTSRHCGVAGMFEPSTYGVYRVPENAFA